MNADKLPTITELQQRTILGIDYGEKVTGLATYTLGQDPFPLLQGRIIMNQVPHWMGEITRIIKDEEINLVVLGIPFFTDGKESGMTRRVKKKAEELRREIAPTTLYLQDETLSSVEAKERMVADPRFNFTIDMKKIDAVAASIIIELFLNEVKNCN